MIVYNLYKTIQYKTIQMKGEISDEKKKSSFLGALCVIIIAFEILVIFYSVIVSLPPNPLSLNKNQSEFIQGFIPQSWGFYSKDPTEAELNVYSMEDNDELIWPNNRVKNVFGLYRYGRAQGTELGLLQAEVPPEAWVSCENDSVSCLLNESKTSIENKTPNPTLCGDIGIAMEEPIPWSWSKNSDQVSMPSQVVRISVKC